MKKSLIELRKNLIRHIAELSRQNIAVDKYLKKSCELLGELIEVEKINEKSTRQ
jgi:hypothetical protein